MRNEAPAPWDMGSGADGGGRDRDGDIHVISRWTQNVWPRIEIITRAAPSQRAQTSVGSSPGMKVEQGLTYVALSHLCHEQ